MKARIPLNGAQKNAINKEIDRQIIERNDEWMIDIEAMVLWTLHKFNGFGTKRLLEFREHFIEEAKSLRDSYEMDDITYPAKYYLKQMGIDIEKLYKEANNGN